MATGIFATVAEVQNYVGANANTTANAEGPIDQFTAEIEDEINVHCGVNYSAGTVFTDLTAGKKELLREACCAGVAIKVLNYDLSGFASLSEAETRLTTLRDTYQRVIGLLKEKNNTKFISAT